MIEVFKNLVQVIKVILKGFLEVIKQLLWGK